MLIIESTLHQICLVLHGVVTFVVARLLAYSLQTSLHELLGCSYALFTSRCQFKKEGIQGGKKSLGKGNEKERKRKKKESRGTADFGKFTTALRL